MERMAWSEDELIELNDLVEKFKGLQVMVMTILKTDWGIELWLNLHTGKVIVHNKCADEYWEEDEETFVGYVGNIYNIEIDGYAKKIVVYKSTEKDVMTIDEDGKIDYVSNYTFKTIIPDVV